MDVGEIKANRERSMGIVVAYGTVSKKENEAQNRFRKEFTE